MKLWIYQYKWWKNKKRLEWKHGKKKEKRKDKTSLETEKQKKKKGQKGA